MRAWLAYDEKHCQVVDSQTSPNLISRDLLVGVWVIADLFPRISEAKFNRDIQLWCAI